MYNSNNIAERIRTQAKLIDVTVKKMLEDIGLGFNTMSNMKTSMPKADNLAKIADYLGCSVDYLLGRTDNPAIKTNEENEQNILDIYRNLNPSGQEQFMIQATILSNVIEYKKCSDTESEQVG